MDHGFYAHPLWSLRKDHGGDWEFTIENYANDDLPLRLDISLGCMKHPLYNLLSKSEMFPKDSKLRAIVQQCYGDGYKALKQILFHSHPV